MNLPWFKPKMLYRVSVWILKSFSRCYGCWTFCVNVKFAYVHFHSCLVIPRVESFHFMKWMLMDAKWINIHNSCLSISPRIHSQSTMYLWIQLMSFFHMNSSHSHPISKLDNIWNIIFLRLFVHSLDPQRRLSFSSHSFYCRFAQC